MTWAEQLMGATDEDEAAWCAAAATCAYDAANRGDFERARDLAARSLASSDIRVLFSAHDTLGNIGIYNGDFATARQHLAVLRTLDDRSAFGNVEALVGETMALTYGGDAAAGLDHLTEHRPTEPISPTGAAWIAYIEGDVLAALGRADEAVARFRDASRLAASVGSTFVRTVAELSALTTRSRDGDVDQARAAFVPVLTHFRRVRSVTHAITAIRNLVQLLVRSGDDEDAMVLFGSVSGTDRKALFGTESERLLDARSTVEARVGHDRVASWIERGAGHDPMWAVDHAISVLS